MASKQTSISRPAARKSASHTSSRRRATGATKPPKTVATSRRAPEPQAEPTAQVAAPKAPRKFNELPKVQGELPTPVATFVF